MWTYISGEVESEMNPAPVSTFINDLERSINMVLSSKMRFWRSQRLGEEDVLSLAHFINGRNLEEQRAEFMRNRNAYVEHTALRFANEDPERFSDSQSVSMSELEKKMWEERAFVACPSLNELLDEAEALTQRELVDS